MSFAPHVRTRFIRSAIAGATLMLAASGASAQGLGVQDPSLIGRPSQDAPDACAALPLEWRLRCYGGPMHTVSEIGAPYGAEAQRDAVPKERPWHAQWRAAGESPCEDDRNLPGRGRLGEAR